MRLNAYTEVAKICMNSATSILFITVRVFMKTLCCGKLGGMCVYVPNLMLLQWDCHCKYTKITYNHLPNNRLPFTFLINIKKIIYTNIVTWIWCIYRNGKIHIKVFKIIFNSIYTLQFKCFFLYYLSLFLIVERSISCLPMQHLFEENKLQKHWEILLL